MPFVTKVKDRLRPWVTNARNRKNTALYGGCAVLLYHRVIELGTDPQLLAVDPDRFDDHLSFLSQHYHVLSVEEFDHHLLGQKRFPKNSVLLTFDDGYADNHLNARPILEKHGMQALFYISSGYIGLNREYWWDELERILLVNKGRPAEFAFESGTFRLSWRQASSVDGEYDRSLEALRKVPAAQRDSILNEIRTLLDSEGPRMTHLPMTVRELQEFTKSSSVVIGAHTVGHPSLARLDEEDQREEIVRSKQSLTEMLGIDVPYFSYPFGTGADFDPTTERLVQDAGFKHVAANYPGTVHARSPRFKFPRFLVRNWDVTEFEKQLAISFST